MSRTEVLARIHAKEHEMKQRMQSIQALHGAYKQTKLLVRNVPLNSDRSFTLAAMGRIWTKAEAKMYRKSPSVGFFKTVFSGHLFEGEFEKYCENIKIVAEQIFNGVANPACRELLSDLLLCLTGNTIDDNTYEIAEQLVMQLGYDYQFGLADPEITSVTLAEIWSIVENNDYWSLITDAQSGRVVGEPA